MLAHSSPQPDGTWPQEPIQETIEAIKSESLERGLLESIVTGRGLTWRSPETGGDPERALAERYGQYAVHVAPRAPRTAAILRRIKAYYDREARWQDRQRDLEEYD
jgi:hypothetical protein